MAETTTQTDTVTTLLPLPTPSRKPRARVREVSSRFMSPIPPPSPSPSTSSSSNESLHCQAPIRSKSPAVMSTPARQQSPRVNNSTSDSVDENKSENCQGFDRGTTPMRSGLQQTKGKLGQHRRSKSSDAGNCSSRVALRLDTPVALTTEDVLATGRVRNGNLNCHRSLAASLLPSSGVSTEPLKHEDDVRPLDSAEQTLSRKNGVSTSDSNSINVVGKCKTRTLADLRSSMPEADMLPNRLLTEKNCNSDFTSVRNSPCSRSLNFPSSNCENSEYNPVKPNEKLSNFMKTGGRIYLPPRPPCGAKLDLDSKKARKSSSHQEDVHNLKMLHNRYLQWRYVNAKAEVSMNAQSKEAERTLHSMSVKLSELYETVGKKRMELELLRRAKKLSTVLEAQIPNLDEWSAIEDGYSTSLSETTQALTNASIQLPINGNIRADTREIGEALNSAVKVMEAIGLNVGSFTPKAEDLENMTSKLANVSRAERTLIDDCGDLLSRMNVSQVEECSLRSQLLQLQYSSNQLQTQNTIS